MSKDTQSIEERIILQCDDMVVSLYEGEYRGATLDGLPNGEGIMKYKFGYDGLFYEKYIGHWKNGKKDGHGVMYYTNGEKHEGNRKNDKKHCNGTHYYINGTKEEFCYDNGKDILAENKKLLKEMNDFIDKNAKGFEKILKKYNK